VDLRVSSLHRLWSWLGGLLVLSSVFNLRYQYRYRPFLDLADATDLGYHLVTLATVVLGIHVAWRAKRACDPIDAQRILGASLGILVVLAGLEESLFENYRSLGVPRQLFFAAGLLVAAAAPLLWGSALVRCQHPMDPRSRSLGRVLAILLTIALALKLYVLVDRYASWMSFLHAYLRPKYLLMTSFRSLPTVFLLKGVIEEQLPVRSPQQAGRRSRSVFWALLGWFLSDSGWWGYEVLNSMLRVQSFAKQFWWGLLFRDLILLVAVGTFLRFAPREPELEPAPESA